MKKEMKKVPDIRFKGFTGDWEQRKVGELTVESKEYKTLTSGLPLLTSSRAGLMYQNEYRGNLSTDSENTLFSVVPLQACTYRHMSDDDIFHLNLNTLEKRLVSREYPVFFASGDNNLYFIVQYINSSSSFRSFCAEQKKGGTRTRLYYSSLCNFKMAVPSSEEQTLIANYIKQLDNLITLHQQKLDQLKKLKAYFLQNLFPAKGEKVPKIRFKGFTGEWEQSKLGNVLIERSILRKQSDEFPLVSFTVKNGVTPKTERYEREQLVVGDKKEKSYKETRLNDIVYNPANLKFGAIARNKYGNAVFSPIYVTYDVREEMALPSFVERFVTRESFIKNALRYQQGTVYERMAVSPNDFETLDILVPTKDEQKKIGDVFDNLDTLITLYQYNLECFQAVKKFLLQNLFV